MSTFRFEPSKKFLLSIVASSWTTSAGDWELTLVSPSKGDGNGRVSYLYGTFNFFEISPTRASFISP